LPGKTGLAAGYGVPGLILIASGPSEHIARVYDALAQYRWKLPGLRSLPGVAFTGIQQKCYLARIHSRGV
jgi:hypothetical protein